MKNRQRYLAKGEEIRERSRRWRDEHPEEVINYRKQYRAENKELLASKDRKYREENAQKINQVRKKYREEHRQELVEKVRLWAQNNVERANTNKRVWVQNNPEKASAAGKQWRDLNPLKRREMKNRRRARLRSNGVYEISQQFLEDLYSSSCVACGKSEDITADHIIPIARGGLHSEENLQPLCGACNSSKRDKTMDEWQGRTR
ncbi:Uncharacterized protein AUMI_114420 [Aurantimicrobium minutum]|uniref:HNH nuclease domain-containing protein n=2 Tax=Aurantimicrobium minutum TaxID=708131 RepID=A0A173LYQ6_9MICO|nr:Uncharacterized protein AUMI_114420 [Aurantimicrobium minutum]